MMRALIAALLLPGSAVAAPTQYPYAIDNCGTPVTIAAPPRTIVSVGQSTTEILYALGAQDRMAGTALWFNDVLEEFAPADAQVPRLADDTPSFESVVGRRPDFVPTMYEWMIGPQGAVGTRQQFADLGIPTYVMPADCVAKDNLAGADGTRLDDFDIATLYQTIDEMARILDLPDRGEALVADLRAREAAVVDRARGLGLGDASAVVWFSSPQMGADPFVAGGRGIPAWMLNALGLRNIVTSDEEWPMVGWETIARADPTVIVIARMDRRRFPADDHEAKLAFLARDPVTRQMTAVRENRIVILDAEAMHPGLRLIDGLETLTDAMSDLTR